MEDSNSIANSELRQKFASLYAYLARRLGIRQVPKLTITNSQENANNPFGFTGYYDHANKVIRLYITNRHDTDVLRSFAHEIIHHWQNERGTLHPQGKEKSAPDDGHYAQNNPWLRKREMEAYLFGNILFRDWQDEQRYGPPQQPTQLPQPFDENLQIKDGNPLKHETERFVQRLISKGIFKSYDRKLQSGHMNPNDFAEDISHKIMCAIEQWTDTMNDRSDYENETNPNQPSAMRP